MSIFRADPFPQQPHPQMPVGGTAAPVLGPLAQPIPWLYAIQPVARQAAPAFPSAISLGGAIPPGTVMQPMTWLYSRPWNTLQFQPSIPVSGPVVQQPVLGTLQQPLSWLFEPAKQPKQILRGLPSGGTANPLLGILPQANAGAFVRAPRIVQWRPQIPTGGIVPPPTAPPLTAFRSPYLWIYGTTWRTQQKLVTFPQSPVAPVWTILALDPGVWTPIDPVVGPPGPELGTFEAGTKEAGPGPEDIRIVWNPITGQITKWKKIN